MGYTRIIFTDATTAEASTVLKGKGFQESADGGCFISYNSPVKIYLTWGKVKYYPELMERLSFNPRIQIHLKSQENGAGLTDLALGTAEDLKELSAGTQICAFDIESNKEIIPKHQNDGTE